MGAGEWDYIYAEEPIKGTPTVWWSSSTTNTTGPWTNLPPPPWASLLPKEFMEFMKAMQRMGGQPVLQPPPAPPRGPTLYDYLFGETPCDAAPTAG